MAAYGHDELAEPAMSQADNYDNMCWEDEALNNGLIDGGKHGETLGEHEGKEFGVKAGQDFGSELGMFKGHCIAWRHMLTLNADFCSERALRGIEVLEKLIDDFPTNNTPDRDFVKSLNECRRKFKVMKSLIKVPDKGHQTVSLGAADLSF